MAASVVTTTFTVQNSELNEPYGDSMTSQADSISIPSAAVTGSAESSIQSPDLSQNNSSYKFEDMMVGLPSFSDVAEKKLQLSLDELIHQQLQQEVNVKSTTLTSNAKIKRNTHKYQKSTGNNANSKNVNFRGMIGPNMRNTKKFVRPQPYMPAAMNRVYYINGIPSDGSNDMALPVIDATSVLPYKRQCAQNAMPASIATIQAPLFPIKKQNARRDFHVLSQDVESLALAEMEVLYPPPPSPPEAGQPTTEEFSLIIRYKGTDVLKVQKSKGDLILNSGGWKTMSTRSILNNALKPIGLSIKCADEKKPLQERESQNQNKLSSDWLVTDGMAFLANFQDGMTISQIGGRSHSHLLARASVIAQHMKQAKSTALSRRQLSRRAWNNF